MPSQTSRIRELDALRGLAAVAVVAFHYTTRYDQLFGRDDPLSWTVGWGHYGVQLFFMLSGFVILMTLDRTEGWASFAWGRFTRLYPAYWAAIGITLLVVTVCGLPGQEVSAVDALCNLTMVQSLLGAEHVDGAYWSLQAEIIFYANMLFLHRAGFFRRPLQAVLAWLALSAAAVGVLTASQLGIVPEAAGHVSKLITLASLKYIPLFGVGILVYAWNAGRLSVQQVAGGVAVCLITAALYGGWPVVAVGVVLTAVLAGAVSGRLKVLRSLGLVYLGALSYPLYLTHQNVGYVVMRKIEAAGWSSALGLVVAGAVAMLIAVGLHRLVERPSLEWLRQYAPADPRGKAIISNRRTERRGLGGLANSWVVRGFRRVAARRQ